MTVLQPHGAPGIAARASHGHSGCPPLHCDSLLAATPASVMRWLQWLWRNVLLLTSPVGQAGDVSPEVPAAHVAGVQPRQQAAVVTAPLLWGFNKDSQGQRGDQMPLEISPWCFARTLMPVSKELSRADLCSLQQEASCCPSRRGTLLVLPLCSCKVG